MKNYSSKYALNSSVLVTTVRYFSLFVSKFLWRIEFINVENIPNNKKGGLIVAPNHQTYFDPFWIGIPIKREMRFMAWDKAFEWFFIGRLISLVGAFPVSLKRGGTIKALKESMRFLREGKTLFVFPEGEREFDDGKLLPFKTGAVQMAIQAKVPILPVTVLGGNRIWSRDQKFPRPGKVKIIYHPIIDFSTSVETESLTDMTKKLENIISSAM